MPPQFTTEQGSPTGIATSVVVGGTPVLAAAGSDSDHRIAVSLQAGDSAAIGISPTMNASVAAIAAVASGAMFEERDYDGALYVVSLGATQVARVWDVRRP